MQQPSTDDERYLRLEQRVAALEQARKAEREQQDQRDLALLARIDSFIEDLHRVERVQLKMFETLMDGQREAKAYTDAGFASIAEILRDHKAALESIAAQADRTEATQQQILAILAGQAKTND